MAEGGFGLERFVAAQEGVFDRALAELAAGAKRGHWMWFIFPQLAGLGRSAMARTYAIGSIEEARAYLAHPLLGPRLRACVTALQSSGAKSAEAALGAIDSMKLRSSLTLFIVAGGGTLFVEALGHWFKGQQDSETLELLARPHDAVS